MTTTTPSLVSTARAHHDWQRAGSAWGADPSGWACLYEHYATDVLFALFPAVGIGPDVDLLDVACGAGQALTRARARGAVGRGLDASEGLVAIARTRNPGADIRVGSMFDLPWEAETFDVVLSVNGIWGHCQEALDETWRVLRPGGLVGLSFWGSGPPLDLRTCFQAVAVHLPAATYDGMKATNSIARDGVAEAMLAASHFRVAASGTVTSVIEWPDEATAWRALASAGPIQPALECADPQELRDDVLAAIDGCRDEHGIYRLRSQHRWIVGRKPSASRH